jgi:hypothetical protein
MGTMREPKWWADNHKSAWERMKLALRRDWEQTKADLTKTKGQELDQDVGDTVKQAVGKERIPPEGVPNPDNEWDSIEPGLRYGVAAEEQYRHDYKKWDDKLESKLSEEWNDLKSGRTWDEMKGSVKRGWDTATSSRQNRS